MAKVAVVYHSGYGHTAEQAKAVLRGVQSVSGIKATLVAVENIEEQWGTLESADAIIFGSPTYMGSASAQFKTFMDASSKVWFTQGWRNKIAAGFTNSGSQSGDKLNTLIQLAIFAAQHSMIWVGLDLMPGNNNSKGSVQDLNRLGGFMGALAQSNTDQGPEGGPIASDLKTAEHLGTRVAQITKQFLAGRS
jgi:multimeric flavodoxin WrbA